jgi:hypothetical protein
MERGEKCSGLLSLGARGRRSFVRKEGGCRTGLNNRAATRDVGAGPPRFVRRTALGAHEYRKNFRQLDCEVIAAITSVEADRVTPLMGKIYLRLVSAPPEFWEREGVLYFAPRDEDGRPVKSSKVLYGVLGVASATAHKALQWMHGQGIIGYFAGKNGAGIRIFLNRAANSIGVREGTAGKKILPFSRGSGDVARGSTVEPAFNDSFADPETPDSDFNPRAPKNGADKGRTSKESPEPARPPSEAFPPNFEHHAASARTPDVISLEDVVTRLREELEPVVREAARQAAAREHERTREWLESRGLPKAARVAQHEAYNVLRKYGVITESARGTRAYADVGRSGCAPTGPHPLSQDEVIELAQACVAMLETKGQSIDVTLSEMSAEAGGFLLPEDAARVREKANLLLSAGDGEGK